MLNNMVKKFLSQNGWLCSDADSEYDRVIQKLGIPIDSDFAEFHRFTTEISFSTSKAAEVMNICWFYLYSDFDKLIKSLWEKRPWGNLSKNYIPFSHYSGDSILLYDVLSEGVYYVNDAEINDILIGKLEPRWKSFNEFLEYYFDIRESL